MFSRRWPKKLRLDAKRLRVESLEDRIVMSASAVSGAPLPVVASDTVQTSAVQQTVEQWVQSLLFHQFNQLSPEEIQYLTPAQVATIPTSGYFGAIPAQSRAALNAVQVRALNVADIRISLLTPQQVGYLTIPQIQSIPFWDFEFLSPVQVPYLTGAQMASINSTSAFGGWSAAAKAALTVPQVRSINMGLVRPTVLSPTQISWLTIGQIQSIANYDLNFLTPNQIPHISTAQIASIPNTGFFNSWSAASRAALTPAQIRAINPAALSLPHWTATQINSLTTAQIQSVNFWEFSFLSPAQIPLLTSKQIVAITSLTPWSDASRAALTASQVQLLNVTSVRIEMLTMAQRKWLTVGQIRLLAHYEFGLLWPSQIPALSAVQMASIPSPGSLAAWSDQARAALTAPHVQTISAAALSLAQLTPQQMGWLAPSQIQRLPVWELHYLPAQQVPYLTATQIAGINARGIFQTWSPASLAALTLYHVRALDVAKAGITRLTPTQIDWLTSAQLQEVMNHEWGSLHAWQIPVLSPSLFASVSAAGTIANLPDSLQVMLTREQLLNLPADVWAAYTLATTAPDNYHPATHMPIGPDGLPIMPHMAEEAAKFFALAPLQSATHVTVASGDWTNPAVWSNGVVPNAGAKVVVSAGTTVRFNAYMNAAIDTLRIDGKLQFATNQNTQLKVDTIVVTTTGVLHVGTASDPVRNHVTARILIADGGPIDVTKDPYKLGRGLVSRGEVRMHGMAVTPYVTLAVQPSAGDTKLLLSSIPSNWRVGDRIVVTGTIAQRDDFGADEVTILAINGSVVTTTAMQFSHHTPAGYALSVHVANLNRNVVLVAEDSSVVAERPHMVFFHNPNVSIDNIGVYGFGRTDKSVPINDPVVVNGVLQPGTGTNPRARYAIHFHHTGVNPAFAPAVVRGSVVEGSPGWGYVNHSSNVDFSDNVAYKIEGSAFVTEDGNEIGSMVRNLAVNTVGAYGGIGSRISIHDFGFQGHGFWFQGPGVEVVDNISAGSYSGGFAYFTSSAKNMFDAVNLDDLALAGGKEAVPVDSVPIKRFSGNTAYAGRTGLEIWHSMFRMNSGQSYIDDFTSWGAQVSGIEMFYSGRITVRNSTLIGNLSNPSGTGAFSNRFTQDITFQNLHAAGLSVGINAPVRGATVVDGGYFAAVQAIFVKKGRDTRRSVDIRGPVIFATLSPSQLQSRRQYSVYMSTYIDYSDGALFDMNALFAADAILFRPTGSSGYRLYFIHQFKGLAPFTAAAAASGIVPAEYLNLKNWQLELKYGKVFSGEMITNYNAFEIPSIFGMVRKLV